MRPGRPAKSRTGLFALGRDSDDDEDLAVAMRTELQPASAVLTPENVPERLVVPAFPVDGDGFSRIEIQLILSGDSLLAVGFTTRELLIERMGAWQPWVSIPVNRLVQLINDSGVTGLLVDPAADLVSPLWSQEDLEALRLVNDVRI